VLSRLKKLPEISEDDIDIDLLLDDKYETKFTNYEVSFHFPVALAN
jgi:hypothetical protein